VYYSELQFYFFRRTYRLGYAFHAILDLVWAGPPKSDIPPNLTPYRFQSLTPLFYPSPSDVCVESLVEIPSAVLEKSPVKINKELKYIFGNNISRVAPLCENARLIKPEITDL